MQKIAQDHVLAPMVRGRRRLERPPLPLLILEQLPWLRRIPGRAIALGIRRERVDLPGMTVAVQCRPDRAGLSRTDIAVVTVFAIELR